MADKEYRLHFVLDTAGHPVYACLFGELETGQLFLLADEDFGPFCTRYELIQWALRGIEHHQPYTAR